MNFIQKINDLRDTYNSDEYGQRDNAFLYGVRNSTPPLATHIIFSPMPIEVMRGMIDDYKLTFPQELLLLYQTMNGANLFWTVCLIGKKQIRIPISCFVIYGIPLTTDRKRIEPANIKVEDLSRPKGTPGNWLKFGSYYRSNDLFNRLDLFVDTDSLRVYAVEHNKDKCCVVDEWDGIDNCLCCVFDSLQRQGDGTQGNTRARFSCIDRSHD